MAQQQVLSELAANVWKITVETGAQVEAGDTLMILESMKMEIPVVAPVAGTVATIHVVEGSLVQQGDAVVTLGIS